MRLSALYCFCQVSVVLGCLLACVDKTQFSALKISGKSIFIMCTRLGAIVFNNCIWHLLAALSRIKWL